MTLFTIFKLLSSLNENTDWVREMLLLTQDRNVALSSSTPGISNIEATLANAKIHSYTANRANLEAVGFKELISHLEKKEKTDLVFIIGIVGLKKRGVLYLSSEEKILGGVVLNRKHPLHNQ
jgi:hypothetical protein